MGSSVSGVSISQAYTARRVATHLFVRTFGVGAPDELAAHNNDGPLGTGRLICGTMEAHLPGRSRAVPPLAGVHMLRRLSTLAVFTGLSFSSSTTRIDLRREELMTALQKGGYTIMLRHARTDRSFNEQREPVPTERSQ